MARLKYNAQLVHPDEQKIIMRSDVWWVDDDKIVPYSGIRNPIRWSEFFTWIFKWAVTGHGSGALIVLRMMMVKPI